MAAAGFSLPSGVELRYAEDRGRYFVASRDLRQGELILEEAPYACVVDSHLESVVCANCWSLAQGPDELSEAADVAIEQTVAEGEDKEAGVLKEPPKEWSIKCNDCRSVWYCSQECKEAHQAGFHRKSLECELFGRFRRKEDSKKPHIWFPSSDITYIRLSIQIIARLEQELRRAGGGTSSDKEADRKKFTESFLEAFFQGAPTSASEPSSVDPENNNLATFQEMWSLVANRDSFDPARLRVITKIANALDEAILSSPSVLAAPQWRKAITPSGSTESSPILYQGAKKKVPVRPLMHRSRLAHLFCKIECNAFGIWLSDDVGIGMAVYPRSSFFNHSCAPTAGKLSSFLISSLDEQGPALQALLRTLQESQYKVATTSPLLTLDSNSEAIKMLKGKHFQWFYALRDVAKDEELSYSYVTLHEAGTVRRSNLKDHYFFGCRCSRCDLDLLIDGNDDGKPSELAAAIKGSKGDEDELVEKEAKRSKLDQDIKNRNHGDKTRSELMEEWRQALERREKIENYVKWILCPKPSCGGIRVTLRSTNQDGQDVWVRICKFCAGTEVVST